MSTIISVNNFGEITIFNGVQPKLFIKSNGDKEPHAFNGSFKFTDTNDQITECFFLTFNLQDTPLPQKRLSKYGTARSPYLGGDSVDPMMVSEELLRHIHTSERYVETILLRELTDRDDGVDSMLRSEKFVIKRIQDAEWLKDGEKSSIIRDHWLYFTKHQFFYKERFEKYKEEYTRPAKQAAFELENGRFLKIQEVVRYLGSITKTL